MRTRDIIKNAKRKDNNDELKNKRRNYFNSTSCYNSNSSNISRSKHKSSIR